MDKVKIKVWFEAQTSFGRYTDSLYFTPEEYEVLTEEQLESMKQERIDRYVARREAYKLSISEPVEADLEVEKADLEAQKADLEARIAELEAQLGDSDGE